MYLIVGLGNPEKKYLNTWHNVGFVCLDKVAQKFGIGFDRAECKSMTVHVKVNGQKVILAKPLTYMNLSGEAVKELTNKYKVEKGNLIVIYDDVDISLGSIRIRKSGSAGTHNGMRSIVQLLATEDFPRVRIGTGKETPMELVDFVLSQIPEEDKPLLGSAIDTAADAVWQFVNGDDIELVMQRFNRKKQ